MASLPSKDPNVSFDMSPFCQILTDGSIKRLIGEEFTPPSLDSDANVISKDITISPNVSARLYLPQNPPKNLKLPIVVYFHGGGFLMAHPYSSFIHKWLTTLVAASNIVAVSVEYRLAPENPLPAAYDDAWTAVNWVATATVDGTEPWLAQHGDLQRLYLAGESAGGNIVHTTAMRAGASEIANGVKIKGIALVQPFFWGSERTASELEHPGMLEFIDPLWEFVCPGAVNGRDDPRVNPMADVEGFAKLGCERVLVSIGGKDTLRDRQRMYCEVLGRSGWKGKVEKFELEDGSHDYQVFEPDSENTVKLSKRLGRFFNGEEEVDG